MQNLGALGTESDPLMLLLDKILQNKNEKKNSVKICDKIVTKLCTSSEQKKQKL